MVSAMSLAFSSAGAKATFAPISFCWARSSSKALSDSTDSVGGEHFVDEFHGLATLAGIHDDIGVFPNEFEYQA